MSYHVVIPQFGFKELPDRILVREDGAYGDHKAHGTPIIDYWYVPEQRISPTEREIISAHLKQLEVDNAKLRKILADACTYLCLVKMSGSLAVEIDKHNVYWDGEKILDRMLDLGVEVDG